MNEKEEKNRMKFIKKNLKLTRIGDTIHIDVDFFNSFWEKFGFGPLKSWEEVYIAKMLGEIEKGRIEATGECKSVED